VNIPFKVQLSVRLGQITDFCIVRFQDKKLQYPEPHWYVLIPTGSLSFLVTMITSQGAKRKEYYKRTSKPKAIGSLVGISNNEFSYLKKDSVVECNQTEYLSIQEIVHRVEEEKGIKIEKEQIPGYLKKEIVSAINNSPIVIPFVKKLAIAANPV